MIDINLINNNLIYIVKNLIKKNFYFKTSKFLYLEKKRKIIQIKTEKLLFNRNKNSKLINKIIKNKNIKKNININNKLNIKKKILKKIKNKIINFINNIPNIISNDIIYGKNNKNNKKILYWGKKKKFLFPILDHLKLCKKNNNIDLKSAIKITGSRFAILKGNIAKLHRSLGQFMIDTHIKKHGYLEINVPYLVNDKSLYGTGQLPKFDHDLFHIKNNNFNCFNKKNNYYLIPTSEVPLTNLFRNNIIKEKKLPIKMVSHTPCFRQESNSYGKNIYGLTRMHQFDKVEIIQIVKPKYSVLSLEKITEHAENILKMLDLPYRKILLCTGDTSFGSYKSYDLEVWLPSKNKYLEVSSCSHMLDFQTRRMKTRYKKKINKNIKLLHTLNGSGLAVGRTLIAILENYQKHNGKIIVPKVLTPYMNNIKYI
ncbi:Serine--tRNA ligase [Candidatus Annandia adelgestsuga]|uniref:Serine--tRNA ligase n=1 Tax=Candidatus Annandia adelgestsuga TaxID=1302411 RepID=A0A3Q9CLA7_9ENTR|nr:serine--tRNA ligase [Candidatus Annandia adelgestsuga]AZP36162.1 Serine--tRNA ligase [Candidatus Annandia adelgestsuga]